MADYWSGHAEGMSSAFSYANIASSMAEARADREIGALENNLGEWQRYASDLKEMLDKSEAELDKTQVIRVANAAALRGEEAINGQLRQALSLLAPDHPFLQDPSLMKAVKIQAATKYANEHGYRYDPVTNEVVRPRS